MKRRKTVDTPLIMRLDNGPGNDPGPCEDWPKSRVRKAVPRRIGLVDFLASKHIPAVDRLWVALHEELLSPRVVRLFTCDSAERELNREREAGREPDTRSWAAVEVARRYADGAATDDELSAAWYAAWSAAAVARSAARSAAWSAARSASRYAAWSASWSAAAVACIAEREWQCAHLAEMIQEEA